MRRGVALLLLSIVFGFLGMAAGDPCDTDEGDCAPLCHTSCVDGCGGCATAPVPSAASSPPGDLVTSLRLVPAPDGAPLSRSLRPDLEPPRA